MTAQTQTGWGAQQPQMSVRDAMRACTRNAAIVVIGLAALIGLLYVLPDIWYGWARVLTRGYTDVLVALAVLWGSIFAAAWCLCVAIKLDWNRASRPFEIGLFGLLSLGAFPAQCALWAMLMDGDYKTNPTLTFLDKIAYGSVWIVLIAGFVSAFGTALLVKMECES